MSGHEKKPDDASNGARAYGLDLLAFGPHPDDVELFCGGLLARMAQLGHRTGIVDLSRGEKSTRGSALERAKEAEAAAKVLGLSHRENLGLPDGWIDPGAGFQLPEDERAKDAPVSRVIEVLRRLRPEIVVVPWECERHPDHEAASALVTRALLFAGTRKMLTDPPRDAFRPRQVLYYPMRHAAQPSFIVDVTDAYATKNEAIRCHASQVGIRAEGPQTLVGSPLSLSSLEARDRFYGAHIGVEYGEPYIVRETLGLADPIDHFRRNAFQPPLFFPER